MLKAAKSAIDPAGEAQRSAPMPTFMPRSAAGLAQRRLLQRIERSPRAAAQWQRIAGSFGAAALPSGPVLQRMMWTHIDGVWYPDDVTTNPVPAQAGQNFERFDDGLDHEEEVEEVPADPYAERGELTDGTIIDYPALVAVMDGVTLGEAVASSVWRAMRQALSLAITMPNKSHPAHGSNFNKKQRPELQIKDWAKPISGDLKAALTRFFHDKYGFDLE